MRGLDSYLYQIELDLGTPLFESRSQYISSAKKEAPVYPEIESPDELRDASQVVQDLAKIDWSFTIEETGFLTHDLHPYPAKFIPQIPGHIISRLSLRGELVFDPFGGSGTTALEAVRLGRRALSTDANDIGTLIGKVKTCNLDRAAATDLHAIRCFLVARISEISHYPAKLCDEYANFIPEIPNIDKWFPLSSRGELALIRSRIEEMESEKARDVARLAMSRIVLAVSFQDSETRYSSKPREIPQGETIKRFLVALDEVIRNVTRTQSVLRYGVCDFITADTRNLSEAVCKKNTVDLIVTSPPYGNANDYHLYHRFRLLWLGQNPQQLAKIEIGSHLRHQKEATGFDFYLSEMHDCLSIMHKVLRPGRYAVLVVGDAVYNKILYNGAESLQKAAEEIGFESLCIIERQIHNTKRSFVAAGRRATNEKLLVLNKPVEKIKVWLAPATYRLWPYEMALRRREIESVLGTTLSGESDAYFTLTVDPYSATKARRLVFTHSVGQSRMDRNPTWQAIIENGFASQPSARKDPKYVTHGLHPYKGKFYPQLAKGLINLCNLKPGSAILDPFCGSGTTLLEGYLNGYRTYGCDLHPLAAKIARAKIGILDINPDVLRETVGTLVKKIERAPLRLPDDREQFVEGCIAEIERWFPIPIVRKLNWLLRSIRGVSDGVLRDLLEVVLSSIIRDISHQDPSDLRIRKRKIPIDDADVFAMYLDALDTQYERIERFWSIKGYSPNHFFPSKIVEGDSRQWQTFHEMGIEKSRIDMILTSPPYATALPYIDTDRLSLLILFGMDSSKRRPLEQSLVGSREIAVGERKKLEVILTDDDLNRLPKNVQTFLVDFYRRVFNAEVGFRRKNMPALLLRFLHDMKEIIQNCYKVMQPHSEAMIVIGDNRMRVKGDYERIPTTDFIQEIALQCGFDLLDRIDISVTTENLIHIKNAITENVVLRLMHP
jgi:DNA modification methylase